MAVLIANSSSNTAAASGAATWLLPQKQQRKKNCAFLLASVVLATAVYVFAATVSESEYLKQLQLLQGTTARTSSSTSSSSSSNFNSSSFLCRALSESGVLHYSADALWNRHLSSVVRASQLRDEDPSYLLREFTERLLHAVSSSPSRLKLSVSTLPRSSESVRRVLGVLEDRYHSIVRRQQQDSDVDNDSGDNDDDDNNNNKQRRPPPKLARPLRIAVLGGSVTIGTNCPNLIREHGLHRGGKNWNNNNNTYYRNLSARKCSWVHRLQKFFDELQYEFMAATAINNTTTTSKSTKRSTVPSLVEVTNLAMGATTTEFATKMFWKFDMLPLPHGDPDIVVNAYSTNDVAYTQHNPTKMFDWMQEFVRRIQQEGDDEDDEGVGDAALSKRQQQCPKRAPPLLLQFDDVLGNNPRSILHIMESTTKSYRLLAEYYGYGSLSYPNVVRDWVYGDTSEDWFSPPQWWWKSIDDKGSEDDNSGIGSTNRNLQMGTASTANADNKKFKSMQHQVHHGLGMHIVTTWIFAYYFLNLATGYCSEEEASTAPVGQQPFLQNDSMASSSSSKFLPLHPPKRLPTNVLPPPLTKDLTLDEVSQLWWKDARAAAIPVTTDNIDVTSSKHTAFRLNDEAGSDGDDEFCRSYLYGDDRPSRRPLCIFSWISGLTEQHKDPDWIESAFRTVTTRVDGWSLTNDHDKLGYVPSKVGDVMELEFLNVTQPIRQILFLYMTSYGPMWKRSELVLETEKLSSTQQWTKLTKDTLSGFNRIGQYVSRTGSAEISIGNEVVQRGDTLRVRYRFTGTEGTTFKVMGLAICS